MDVETKIQGTRHIWGRKDKLKEGAELGQESVRTVMQTGSLGRVQKKEVGESKPETKAQTWPGQGPCRVRARVQSKCLPPAGVTR